VLLTEAPPFLLPPKVKYGIFYLSELCSPEKLEIVKDRGEAAPNFWGLSRRNAFELIQEYSTN